MNLSASPTTTPRFAGFWIRTLAAIIDTILCQGIAMIVAIPLVMAVGALMADTYPSSEIEAAGGDLGFLCGILTQWLWFTIAESSKWQATFGKKIVGLKVTDEHGQRIGFGRANGRYWAKILSSLVLCAGFLMVAFTDKKQGLHDKLAETLVITASA